MAVDMFMKVEGASGESQDAKIKSQYWEQGAKGSKGAQSGMGFSIKENRQA
jgi:hypothetical protein